MAGWMRHIVLVGLLAICAMQAHAQVDPTLAGMVYLYTEKAEDQLKAQERTMLMQTTGHIWTREEVEGTTDIQRKFNDYLDSFRDIISYAAQIYGFYHEVGKLAENMGSLNDQLRAHAGNAIAVALTPNRNRIYQELILGSVEIVNDIRQVCLSDTKMTEKQRIELVFGIRPKLKVMNKHPAPLALEQLPAELLLELVHRLRDGLDRDALRPCGGGEVPRARRPIEELELSDVHSRPHR